MKYRRRSSVEILEPRQLLHAGHDHAEPWRVDAGSSAAFTDSLGRVWEADNGFSGGGTDTTSFPVAGTSDPKLYTSRRAGAFTYAHAVPDGTYKLDLHFADYHTRTGVRRFSVAAEGQTILNDFDIVAAGGGQRAVVRSFDITVTGGEFNLAFIRGAASNPVVSAFELTPLDTPPPVVPDAPSQLNVRTDGATAMDVFWTDNSGNETGFEIERSTNGVDFMPRGSVGPNVLRFDDSGLTPETRYFYRVRAVNGAGESGWSNIAADVTAEQPSAPPNAGTIIRVDAAGTGPYTDTAGKVWAKDSDFVGGGPNTGTFAVANTTDDNLFATRRTGAFTYSRAVPNGSYTLNLLFADHYTTVGTRVFNVFAEGQQVLSNFDIVKEAGSKVALIKSFDNVTVSDGKIDLSFQSIKGHASLSALELIANAPTVVPAAPTNLALTPLTGKIRLAWQDNSLNEDDFEIWRSVNGGPFALLATRNMEETSYEDAGLDAANTYGYFVRAINSAGPSDPSNTESAKPLAGAPTDTFTKITWSTRAAAPIGRAEALHAVIDGKLYVFAGFSGNNGPVARADVYDPATNTWTRIADMPRRLTHAGTTSVERDVYFAGGYIGTGPGYQQQFGTEEVWRYNVDSNTYTRMPDLPSKLAGGGLVAVGRNLHYFGGNNSSRQDVAVHYMLNLDNLAAGWALRKSMITARSHMGYVNFDGKVYAIAGQKGNDGALTPQSAVEVYDPATDTWIAKKSMPKGINHISSSTFVMGGRILVLGGQTTHNSPIADCYAYDPATDKWVSLSPLPATRFSGVAGAINGVIYFTGGSSQTTTWRGISG